MFLFVNQHTTNRNCEIQQGINSHLSQLHFTDEPYLKEQSFRTLESKLYGFKVNITSSVIKTPIK